MTQDNWLFPTTVTNVNTQKTVMLMQITADHQAKFYTADGLLWLTIGPDGMTDGNATVDIGDAGTLFVNWVRDTCQPSAKDAEEASK
jgi:hypothetical protein